MDDSSTKANNIFCILITAVLLIGPIVYSIAVRYSWKMSERIAGAVIAEAVEGGSLEEKKDFPQIVEEEKETPLSKEKESLTSSDEEDPASKQELNCVEAS